MRATVSLLFAGILLLSGCSAPSNDSSKTANGAAGSAKKILVGLVFDKGGVGDKSFNDSANRGLTDAAKELGIQTKTVDSKSESEYETNLEALADAGADLVVGVGISMKDAVEAAAKKYPKVKFAIVDAEAKGDNVRSLLFREEEGSFLAGYVAGAASKTGKIGFVGGMDLPLIRKFQYGYEAGALYANPKIVCLPAKFTGDWVNIDLGKTSANSLYGDGADVVYAAAGRAGLGVIAAATEAKKYAIGVDSDQDELAKGTVLTSMVKHVDAAVKATIEDVAKDKFTSGSQVYDLSKGGVGITEMPYTKAAISDAQRAKLKEIASDISSGKLKVPATEDDYKAFVSAQGKK